MFLNKMDSMCVYFVFHVHLHSSYHNLTQRFLRLPVFVPHPFGKEIRPRRLVLEDDSQRISILVRRTARHIMYIGFLFFGKKKWRASETKAKEILRVKL